MHLKLCILVSVSLLSMLASACNPTTSAPPAAADGTSRKRRAASDSALVSVTIVSTQSWNTEMNEATLKNIYQLIELFEQQHNIVYDTDRLQHEARNIGGKLAVHYQLTESCQKINEFVQAIRQAYANHIEYGLVACPHQPLSVL